MRRSLRRWLVVATTSLLAASDAAAAALPFIGELGLTMHAFGQASPTAPIVGQGVAEVNPLGGVHLTHANVPAGVFAPGPADVNCVTAHRDRETHSTCGLGAELVVFAVLVQRWRARGRGTLEEIT
jgi:hypothetical protein